MCLESRVLAMFCCHPLWTPRNCILHWLQIKSLVFNKEHDTEQWVNTWTWTNFGLRAWYLEQWPRLGFGPGSPVANHSHSLQISIITITFGWNRNSLSLLFSNDHLYRLKKATWKRAHVRCAKQKTPEKKRNVMSWYHPKLLLAQPNHTGNAMHSMCNFPGATLKRENVWRIQRAKKGFSFFFLLKNFPLPCVQLRS